MPNQVYSGALYERVRDILEQTAAMVPQDERSARLRVKIEEAIEEAMELANTRRSARVSRFSRIRRWRQS
ncbi:MAG TPA: hypothetical protein VGM83_16635 [Devosiaceae bacterium]|jgi:hypothetical protein